jgi:predicted permease
MADALIETAVPILLLIGAGFLSRKIGVLKSGDERVLSERYEFYKETIASLTLISSLGAIVYLNIWPAILGI